MNHTAAAWFGEGPHIEGLEPRVLLSGVEWLAGLIGPEDLPTQAAGQVVYLDFDGESDVTYSGPVTIENIDVRAFAADAPDVWGREGELVEAVTTIARDLLRPLGVTVTGEAPAAGEYATIYVGGASDAFAEYGRFWGVSEAVDAGNASLGGQAFVFSDVLAGADVAVEAFPHLVASAIAHEAGHLVGLSHVEGGDTWGPLAAVAHGCDVSDNTYVHQWIAAEAVAFYDSQYAGSMLSTYLGTVGASDNDGHNPLNSATSVGDDILEGTYEEDTFGVWMNHFSAGGDGGELNNGLSGFDSAYERASDFWSGEITAAKFLANPASTFYTLGRVAHLVADSTVPAHVHLDEHPFFDTYEYEVAENDSYGGRHVWFQDYSAADAIGDMRTYATLEAVFRETTDYTDDYDSDDANGDYGTSNAFSAARISELGLTSRHRPDLVDRSDNSWGWHGGIFCKAMSGAELQRLADDLMPWAIEQTAALYRVFFAKVDASAPGGWWSNLSADEAHPTYGSGLTATLQATDAQSGVDKDGYSFVIERKVGGAWTSYASLGPTTDTVDVSGFGDGLYRIRTTAVNGAGDSSTSSYRYFLQGETGAPPTVTGIVLNGDRSVSDIEPSGTGVQIVQIAFSEAVNFTSGDVTLQKVTFPDGTELVGDTLTPASITGSGTPTMTITFDSTSVVDTWVKVTLDGGATITDLAGIALDGETASGGSGRGYIYDAATDLPTGDGAAGGDAVFYVGSLCGDLYGGDLFEPDPNGELTDLDVAGFIAAYQGANLDGDFYGGDLFDPIPDGNLDDLDVAGFIAAYQGGAWLDPLPTSPSGAALGAAMIPDMNEAAAVWPHRAFSPYVDATLWIDGGLYDFVGAAQQTGVRYFNLAFVVADASNEPAWGGYSDYAVTNEFRKTEIESLRALGGDVIVSFGGANGTPLAAAITDPDDLKAAYQSVIDTYDLTVIDFDIEGIWAADPASIGRRSSVMADLQTDAAVGGDDLGIWLTLPVLPTGLTADGLNVVNAAIGAGVDLAGVNIMAMDYGDSAAPNPDGQMGDYAIQAATSLFHQLKVAYVGAGIAKTDEELWHMVGVTPMIGINDVQTEVFDQTEAAELLVFAQQQDIGMLSFWSLPRDRTVEGLLGQVSPLHSGIQQDPFEFAEMYLPFTGDGGPTLLVSNVAVDETDAGTVEAVFTVTLTPTSDQTVTVDFATADGGATAGADYASTSGTLTFDPDTTQQTVAVTVHGDLDPEDDETFFVNLSNASGASITDGQGRGTIRDNDGPIEFSIDDVSVLEGDTGTTDAVFTVTLTRAPKTGETVQVHFATSNDTAVAGADYQSASGTLTFASRQAEQTISIAVIGEADEEDDETFHVDLSTPVGGTIVDAHGVGTIEDDDTPISQFQWEVTTDWGTGFQGALGFVNTSGVAFNDWRLEFDLTHDITSIWDAEVLSHVGNHYVIGPAGWNAQVQPGGTVSFGFVASPGSPAGPPGNLRLLTDLAGPPVMTGVALNGDRTVSDIEPSGTGVQAIEITFSEAVTFTSGDVTLQKVTFPGGAEMLGDVLTPTSITGDGTDTMTVTFDSASVVDTWVKVTLDSGATITDLAGIALDGEAPSSGSGRGYIHDATDLPTGDGTAGGDAVFYVGALRGDLYGGDLFDPDPNGELTDLDVAGFIAAYQSSNLDADFYGGDLFEPVPDGNLDDLDVAGFIAVYQAGASLDELPTSLSGAAASGGETKAQKVASVKQDVGAVGGDDGVSGTGVLLAGDADSQDVVAQWQSRARVDQGLVPPRGRVEVDPLLAPAVQRDGRDAVAGRAGGVEFHLPTPEADAVVVVLDPAPVVVARKGARLAPAEGPLPDVLEPIGPGALLGVVDLQRPAV